MAVTTDLEFPMYIGGAWWPGERGGVFESRSPASGKVLGRVPRGTPADVDRAVQAATRAARQLAKMNAFERAELCVCIANAISANREELAETLSKEHGKPLYAEALGEVDASATAFRDAAEQVKWMTNKIVTTRDPNKRAFVYRRPRGVYGVITPWNFPLGVACIYYLGPGLAAGNSIVWVPPPTTSAVASHLMRCIHEADILPGAINLVTGEGPVVGDAVVTHPGVRGIGFTGSTTTGMVVAHRAAGKPCFLELGGNGPTIVLDDADPELAASAISSGCFSNAGQICTSTERILAQESIADNLVGLITEYAAAIQLGDPLDRATTMGPVHTHIAAQKIMDQIAAATAKGAKVIAGGKTLSEMPTEQFVEATVVDRVPADCELNTDETFGPVAPVIRVSRIDDLPKLVSASSFGLSAAIFGRDIERAMRLGEGLPCGIVNINEASSYWEPQIPAGGASGSASGYGRAAGPWSIEEMTETHTIVLNLPRDHEVGW